MSKLPALPPFKPLRLPPLKKAPSPAPEKDPRKYLETFFGKRNGIEGTPQEGINYTQETLTYMSSRNRADEITQILVDKMKQKPFQVIECCSGIGGNTLSFLDNPNISFVTAYELIPERREMLKNNISMYNLGNKASISEVPFETFPTQCNNCAGFIDAPWLPANIPGQESTKEQYILSGMKVGNKSLEQIISEAASLKLIALKVPLGYQLEKIPGVRVEEFPLKKFLLLLAYPVKQEDPWRQNLKSFLRNELLPRTGISSPATLDKLVSDEAMKTWEITFTSESYNPNIGENYEEYELLGDKTMYTAYVRYMMQTYPEITRSQLSELSTFYLAKSFQSRLSGSLGIGNHIRSRFRTTIHMLEDVLEALFGALVVIGDAEFKFGAGFGLAYNLLVNLYKDIEIDWTITLGNPKTRIKQIFEQLQWINPKNKEKPPEEIVKDEYGNVTFTISFPDIAVSQLRSLGIPLTSKVLASATANTQKKASNEAYIQAVKKLEEFGITDEMVAEVKKRRDFENPELIAYINAASERLKEEGFSEFYLHETHIKGATGKTTSKYIQMIGIRPDGQKEVLSMTEEPIENVIEGKQQVLDAYASRRV